MRTICVDCGNISEFKEGHFMSFDTSTFALKVMTKEKRSATCEKCGSSHMAEFGKVPIFKSGTPYIENNISYKTSGV